MSKSRTVKGAFESVIIDAIDDEAISRPATVDATPDAIVYDATDDLLSVDAAVDAAFEPEFDDAIDAAVDSATDLIPPDAEFEFRAALKSAEIETRAVRVARANPKKPGSFTVAANGIRATDIVIANRDTNPKKPNSLAAALFPFYASRSTVADLFASVGPALGRPGTERLIADIEYNWERGYVLIERDGVLVDDIKVRNSFKLRDLNENRRRY
jgi:hypothetical protein